MAVAADMRKHLPLILLALFIATVQVFCTYWFAQHHSPVVADRLERLHVDVTNGVVYSTYATTENGSVTVGMTPRAALQTQTELGRLIAEIQRKAHEAKKL